MKTNEGKTKFIALTWNVKYSFCSQIIWISTGKNQLLSSFAFAFNSICLVFFEGEGKRDIQLRHGHTLNWDTLYLRHSQIIYYFIMILFSENWWFVWSNALIICPFHFVPFGCWRWSKSLTRNHLAMTFCADKQGIKIYAQCTYSDHKMVFDIHPIRCFFISSFLTYFNKNSNNNQIVNGNKLAVGCWIT